MRKGIVRDCVVLLLMRVDDEGVELTYSQIARAVRDHVPGAKTSPKSVAKYTQYAKNHSHGITHVRGRPRARRPSPHVEALAALPATALADALAGPTLFDIRQGEAPLFISVLVHGDETSGWEAMCRLRAELLNASALLFVGNVAAAKAGVRVQPGRPDFNRVWQGGDSPEAAVADEVAQRVGSAAPRLAVDVHSTTGRNPAYSVRAARQDCLCYFLEPASADASGGAPHGHS